MLDITEYFDLANPSGGYPYYYKKAAELWMMAKNRYDYILLNPGLSSSKDIEEINTILLIVHKLLTWLMFDPKANLNEIYEYRKLYLSSIIDTSKLEQLPRKFYDNKAIFLRHTETKWELSKVITGPQNMQLSQKGIERIFGLAGNAFFSDVSTVYYSPTFRCRDTALVLSSMYPNMNLIEEYALRERFYGNVDKNPSLQNELLLALEKKDVDFSHYVQNRLLEFPGHETIRRLNIRVAKTFKQILYPLIENNRDKQEYLLFVGHGSWLQSLATHLHISLKRIINSEDYATPLLFYPFNKQDWNVLDLTKLKFLQYILQESKVLAFTNFNILATLENNVRTWPNLDIQGHVRAGENIRSFSKIFLKHYPRERCPTIDLSHTLNSIFPEKYLTKLSSNEGLLNKILDNFKVENTNLINKNLWIDDHHILAMVDGMPFKKVEYYRERLNGLEILIMWYFSVDESIFTSGWFSNIKNLLALKEIILNVGTHPKAKGKTGAEACGILVGLSPKEVEKEWFTYEHALAVQRGIDYKEIIGLTPAKALGLSCGMSLENMLNTDFSIYHAYLMLSGDSPIDIMGLTAEEAKGSYCKYLPADDITHHLTKEGYFSEQVTKTHQDLNKQFEMICIKNDHDLLKDFILINDLLTIFRFTHLSPLGLAVERNWEDIIDAYVNKNLSGAGVADYHAEVIGWMFEFQRQEMCKKFINLDINVLHYPMYTDVPLIVFATRYPEFQNHFQILFNKIPEPLKGDVLSYKNTYGNIYDNNLIASSIVYGCIENIKFLLKVDSQIDHDIIAFAATQNQPVILEIICDHVTKNGDTQFFFPIDSNLLIFAATNTRPQNIKILLKYVKNVDYVDISGNTALHLAASNKDFESSELLLRHGADIFKKNVHDIDPAGILCNSGFDKVLDYIPSQHEQKDDLYRLLSLLASSGHLNLLKKMIEKFKIDINDCPSQLYCPLHHAAIGGHLEIVKYLLQIGANLSLFYQNSSAAYVAVSNNRIPVLELLLDNNADINEQSFYNGRSLLMYSIMLKFEKMSEVLISRGIDITLQDRDERTALSYAAQFGMVSIGEALLKKGANFNTVDIFGQNAFSYVIYAKSYAFSALLIKYGYRLSSNKNFCDNTKIFDLFSGTTLTITPKVCAEYLDGYADYLRKTVLLKFKVLSQQDNTIHLKENIVETNSPSNENNIPPDSIESSPLKPDIKTELALSNQEVLYSSADLNIQTSDAAPTIQSEIPFDKGAWDPEVKHHPDTREPIFTYRVFKGEQEVGSALFYKHPLCCRSANGDRHNVIELKGILSNVQINASAIQEICESLPPTLLEKIIPTATSALQHGTIKGVANTMGYALQKTGFSSQVAELGKQAVYYGGFFATRFYNYCNTEYSETQQTTEITSASYQAAIDTGILLFTNIAIQKGCDFAGWLGQKTNKMGWSKTGQLLGAIQHYGGYGRYAFDSYTQGVTNTITNVVVGGTTEKAVEAVGTVGVNALLYSYNASLKKKTHGKDLESKLHYERGSVLLSK